MIKELLTIPAILFTYASSSIIDNKPIINDDISTPTEITQTEDTTNNKITFTINSNRDSYVSNQYDSTTKRYIYRDELTNSSHCSIYQYNYSQISTTEHDATTFYICQINLYKSIIRTVDTFRLTYMILRTGTATMKVNYGFGYTTTSCVEYIDNRTWLTTSDTTSFINDIVDNKNYTQKINGTNATPSSTGTQDYIDLTIPTIATTNIYTIYIIGWTYWHGTDIDENYINPAYCGVSKATIACTYNPTTATTEIVDIPGMMFTILTMPFSFISQAFNLTIFEGTPYQVNISQLFLGILAIAFFLWILKLILGKVSIGDTIGNSKLLSKKKNTKQKNKDE